jgi:hypothetical protein
MRGIRADISKFVPTSVVRYLLPRCSLILLLAAGACQSSPSAPSDIPVAEISVYNRAEWQHWIDADGDCQDTRQEVLIEESLVAPTLDPRGCRVMSGMWRDEYTGSLFTDPGDLDIDHRVSLATAHRHGGWAWDPARKRAYANDLQDPAHLVAVSASANRSKSDRGPDEWRPPLRDSWCHYANTWRAINQRWTLVVSPAEETALREMCP